VFLPLYDRNPLKIVPFQFVTLALIAANVLVFLWQSILTEPAAQSFTLGYGLVPVVLLDQVALPVQFERVPAELTLLTSAFLHGDFWHLLGNMLFLWVFGDNIEDAMGHWRFLLFYIGCAILAGLTHVLFSNTDRVPLIGASGAVAGVLGAYLILHPKVKVLVLVFSRIPLFLPAHLLLGGWLLLQFWSLTGGTTAVAWWAHIGGFVSGMLLIPLLRYRHIPLFDRGTTH